MKLLIAEDEKDLAEALSVFLEKNLYTVDTVHNGADAYEYASTGAYDAIILDIMMPKLNGLQVLSRLREDGVATPVMLLTAKGQKDDRIAGFDAGADDYLPKPFEPRELLLRINSILRRVMSKPPEKQKAEVKFGAFRYNLDDHALYRGSERVRLPLSEDALLSLLAQKAGQDISREELAQKTGNETNLRTIDVQITRLRRRIEPDSGQPRYIQTVRGKGYSLIPD